MILSCRSVLRCDKTGITLVFLFGFFWFDFHHKHSSQLTGPRSPVSRVDCLHKEMCFFKVILMLLHCLLVVTLLVICRHDHHHHYQRRLSPWPRPFPYWRWVTLWRLSVEGCRLHTPSQMSPSLHRSFLTAPFLFDLVRPGLVPNSRTSKRNYKEQKTCYIMQPQSNRCLFNRWLKCV